ncbi:MAG: type II toxin-antitoxin system VapC family toxin [Aigarchaeota archaeon]|nr:type II toxin-antitoxin system VapC family toxin [Candidatus Pelearchaeum maunauluense]
MRIFMDSNLLIYLNAVRAAEARAAYENFYLNLLAENKAYTDVLVLDELLYISKKKYNIPYNVSIQFIKSIVQPYVEILALGSEEFGKASEIINSYNIKPSDALHAAAMTVNSISKIVSEDKEFDRIKGLNRIWLT